MDISSANWLSDWEIDPTLLGDHWPLEDHHGALDFDFRSFSPVESHSSYPLQAQTPAETTTPPHPLTNYTSNNPYERPAKQHKTTTNAAAAPKLKPAPISWNNNSSASSHIISFGNSSNSPPPSDVSSQPLFGNLDCVSTKPKAEPVTIFSSQGNSSTFPPARAFGAKRCEEAPKATPTRTALHAQDHVLAERKRREKLSQRFIALSAIVPGLKKTDKASVLGDAIRYVKQLQERVRGLEEQTKKRTVESVVFVKKSQLLLADDDNSSSVDESNGCDQSLPEIEAKISEKNVLVKIHCEKHKGLVPNILVHIEKLGLTVVNSSVLPFGDYALDITLIAKMDNGFNMALKDVVSSLRQTVQKLIM